MKGLKIKTPKIDPKKLLEEYCYHSMSDLCNIVRIYGSKEDMEQFMNFALTILWAAADQNAVRLIKDYCKYLVCGKKEKKNENNLQVRSIS